MKEHPDLSIALCSCPNEETALHIATRLVENKLAACVNIIPNLTSIYRWQGKICQDNEYLMLIKTTLTVIPRLKKQLKAAILMKYQKLSYLM